MLGDILMKKKKNYVQLDRHISISLWISACSSNNLKTYGPIKLLPTERRCHVTAGVAKQANTSSVLLKCVRWGLATAWPRHWPHIRTCPLCVFAADVWLVWHAATSTILPRKITNLDIHLNLRQKKAHIKSEHFSNKVLLQSTISPLLLRSIKPQV